MREQERENVSKMEATVFLNLILEVISHHFHCILFARRKSLGPNHTKREDLTEGHEFLEAEITEGHLRSLSTTWRSLETSLPNPMNSFFLFLATPRGLWDFSSLTRD